MSEDKEIPDLTLLEADIRNVVTVKELVDALRGIDGKIDRLSRLYGEFTVQLDRLGPMEKVLREIALGLGVRP